MLVRRDNIDRYIQAAMLHFMDGQRERTTVRQAVVHVLAHVDEHELEDMERKAGQWGYYTSYEGVLSMLCDTFVERFGDMDEAYHWAVKINEYRERKNARE